MRKTIQKRQSQFLLVSIFIFLASLLTASEAIAQTRTVIVPARDAVITIQTDGSVRYQETWEVQFDGGPFTFAFRSIPTRAGEAIVDWGVSESGVSYQQASGGTSANTYLLSREGGEEKITWYFPPTSNQSRTFVLSYTVEGSIGIYDEGDVYFWKFIESDRAYTILSSTVTLRLPGSFTPDQLELAGFINGIENLRIMTPGDDSGTLSGESNARIIDSQTIEFSGLSFTAGEEWEIGVRFPHGVVTSAPPRWQVIEDSQAFFGLAAMCAAMIFLLLGGLGLYLLWYRFGRDKPVGVKAEFIPKPPQDIPPGLAGTLLDERADMEDIIATLVDLARRGYIQIVEEKQSSFGTKGEFRFVREKTDTSGLRAYEKSLLSGVFGRSSEKELSDLKNKFYTKLPGIRKEMYTDIVKEGFFPTDPDRVRSRYSCSGLLLTGAVGLFAWLLYGAFSETTPLMLCTSIAMMTFPLGLLIFSRYMPRKSEKGARAAAQWGAFKNYLDNIEKYTKLQDAQEQFDRYLPYAIAFGLEKGWVKKFTEVRTPVPIWYNPYPLSPRTATRRARTSGGGVGESLSGGGGVPSLDQAAGGAFQGLESMSTGFFNMLDSASNTLVSAPSSSGSGGGGGGFSGGGGGGGGSSGFG